MSLPESGDREIVMGGSAAPRVRLSSGLRPFQRALVRGLAVVMPPLLTIVLFIWAWNTIENYVLSPVERITRNLVAWSIDRSLSESAMAELVAAGNARPLAEQFQGRAVAHVDGSGDYVNLRRTWIPREVFALVESAPDDIPIRSAADCYQRYVSLRYLRRSLVLPAFLALFIVLLYLIGKLLAVGVGRLLWSSFERLIGSIPLIRNVYSAVKQVTDFAFNQNENAIKVTRIVAVQYPRQGIWSLGFVTGEPFPAVAEHVGEPMVNVLMPTSPMPATGFTIMVPRSQTVDLNISMDQAIQFCVSCGVVTQSSGRTAALVDGAITVPDSMVASGQRKVAGQSNQVRPG